MDPVASIYDARTVPPVVQDHGLAGEQHRSPASLAQVALYGLPANHGAAVTISRNAARAAYNVASISTSPCALEMKPASNALGAK